MDTRVIEQLDRLHPLFGVHNPAFLLAHSDPAEMAVNREELATRHPDIFVLHSPASVIFIACAMEHGELRAHIAADSLMLKLAQAPSFEDLLREVAPNVAGKLRQL